MEDKSLPVAFHAEDSIQDSVDRETKTFILQVLEKNNKTVDDLSPEEYQQIFDTTKTQVIQKRVRYVAALRKAEAQLAELTAFNVGIANPRIGGLRNPIIIILGGWVYARDRNWIFEPVQHQLMHDVARYPSRPIAVRALMTLRKQMLDTCERAEDGSFTKEGWKDDLLKIVRSELENNII